MTKDEVLEAQNGVISRAQLLACGHMPHDIRRLLRSRELAQIHPGVYADHTGQPTWHQRAWAAVLACWPSALCDESALRAADGPGRRDREDQVIHVAVDHARNTRGPTGVVVRRVLRFRARVQWNYGPPRVRYEDAALDVAADAANDMAAIAVLAGATQSRRTTARRLIAALDARERTPRRRWIANVLADIADGTCSVLEHGYATRVERPHGLPRARRQERASASVGVVYRDVEYSGRVIIELDGRLFHDSASARDRDLERDLDSAIQRRTTARLGWGQVFDRPCSTAAKVVALLREHGIEVNPAPCCPTCLLGGSVPSRGTDPPNCAA